MSNENCRYIINAFFDKKDNTLAFNDLQYGIINYSLNYSEDERADIVQKIVSKINRKINIDAKKHTELHSLIEAFLERFYETFKENSNNDKNIDCITKLLEEEINTIIGEKNTPKLHHFMKVQSRKKQLKQLDVEDEQIDYKLIYNELHAALEGKPHRNDDDLLDAILNIIFSFFGIGTSEEFLNNIEDEITKIHIENYPSSKHSI
jgi:hypothetical protein